MSFKATLSMGPRGTGPIGINTEAIVDATATAKGVRSACAGKAEEVAAKAAGNLKVHQARSRAEESRADVLKEVHTMSVEEFLRENGELAGTIIPVALAVSDHPASLRWEYGSGRRIPMTRFMRASLESSGGGKWKRWVAR